ncbi:unnamed protein product [Ilex paraguariensis]|uniref:Uncharacterized protein n=1 Tax=Ilex paraguariensis TaxID=185542 RepID=A0ABC8UD13_9AQUA
MLDGFDGKASRSKNPEYDHQEAMLETKVKPNLPLNTFEHEPGVPSPNDVDEIVKYLEDPNCFLNVNAGGSGIQFGVY